MDKTIVTITPYRSIVFPWMAKVGRNTWVFESVEIAKTAMIARFGDCIFRIRED